MTPFSLRLKLRDLDLQQLLTAADGLSKEMQSEREKQHPQRWP
jgi:hypothetical protein